MATDPATAAALGELAAAYARKGRAETDIVVAVAAARDLDQPWRAIADQVNMAQPNATRKFKPLIEQLGERPAFASGDAALTAIRAAHRARDAADREILQAVARARTARATWDDIARVLEMRQPNAVAKFKPLLEETTVVTVRKPQ